MWVFLVEAAGVTSKIHTLADLLGSMILTVSKVSVFSQNRTSSWETPVHAHEWGQFHIQKQQDVQLSCGVLSSAGSCGLRVTNRSTCSVNQKGESGQDRKVGRAGQARRCLGVWNRIPLLSPTWRRTHSQPASCPGHLSAGATL